MRVPGQENLLLIADRVVVAAQAPAGGHVVTWEGDRLTVEGDKVTWKMSVDETAALRGTCKVELTIFAGSDVYKTETAKFEIKPSIWDNGGADDE